MEDKIRRVLDRQIVSVEYVAILRFTPKTKPENAFASFETQSPNDAREVEELFYTEGFDGVFSAYKAGKIKGNLFGKSLKRSLKEPKCRVAEWYTAFLPNGKKMEFTNFNTLDTYMWMYDGFSSAPSGKSRPDTFRDGLSAGLARVTEKLPAGELMDYLKSRLPK